MAETAKNEEEKKEVTTEAPAAKAGAASQDVKTMAALAYIIFFIPMLTNKDSKFAMFHANQGLLLLISVVVLNFVVGILGGITFFFGGFLLWGLPGLVGLIFAIMGIMGALNGEMKPLPVVGGITLIK